MKRTIFIFMFVAAASIPAAAQLRAARESITEDAYQEAIDAADDRSVKFSERTTSVSKDSSSAILTKTVSEVFESTPSGSYRLVKITELIGKGTEREERVSVGRKQYQRTNNGPWRIPSLSNFAMVEARRGKNNPW